MITIFKGAAVVLENGTEKCDVAVRNGRICDISKDMETHGAKVIDCEGKYLFAGFIDLHVHGGGGADFMDGTQKAMETAVRAHLIHGTTTLYPTTMSSEFENIRHAVGTYRAFRESGRSPATLGGLHLEGPFISPAMCGAQRRDLVYAPGAEHLSFLRENADVIARISCAPEVPGVLEMAKALLPLGIRFSMGHTNATYEQAQEAFEAGFGSVTHLYSATSGFHKVNQRVHIGVTQAAYGLEDLYAELIGDGRHVPKELLQLVVRFKGIGRVCLVTDAMRAAGTDLHESYLGAVCPENRVIIEDGVAKLPDRSSFAGSIGTMDRALKFAICEGGLRPFEASRLASLTPATLMGIDNRKGSIRIGKDADFVLTDEHFDLCGVFVGGEDAFEGAAC